jgi:high-affinity Fe2+/Pb2+ permease
MNLIIIESLFLLLFVIGILAYVKGRKDHMPLLISLGQRSSIILGILIVFYSVAIAIKGAF